MNKAAQALGRMGKGKPKTLTKAERKRRAERLAKAREKRWADKANSALSGGEAVRSKGIVGATDQEG
jgi:hypothetical protein